MIGLWRWLAVGCLLLGGTLSAQAEVKALDAPALAERIDHYIAAGWKKAGVQPAPLADDAEFIRRVYLDLAGRIPSVAEVRTFLEDRRPDKRARLIKKLLNNPRYVMHYTRVWRALLLPETDANFQVRFLAGRFENWLREKLRANTPYDQVVHELLTVPVGGGNGRNLIRPGASNSNPLAFYLAKELKPENLAGATTRLFLGVKLECAQCHDHPFADWKKEQFWQFAAFFSGLRRTGPAQFPQPGAEKIDQHEITIPGSNRVVKAHFLDGKTPTWKEKVSARQTLADWLTARDNPYFARATVNRLWAQFFGRGLIDPVDEMVGGGNQASHPELLDELARQFVANGFDLKYLLEAITLSQTYQRSSQRTDAGQDDPRWFARMPLRGLSGEQLWDSVAQATGYREGAPSRPGLAFRNNRGARAQFLRRFNNSSDRPTETHTSILQALTLMNGEVVGSATSLEQSETLAAILDAPFLDTEGRIETLFLATLSRLPSERERQRFLAYVEKGGASEEADSPKANRQALADVFWVLLNSGEFILNH